MSKPSVLVFWGVSVSAEGADSDSATAEALASRRDRTDLRGGENRNEEDVEGGGALATERSGGGSLADCIRREKALAY